MRDNIIYEWSFETVIDGDIEDVCFNNKLTDFSENQKTDTLCLVRRSGNNKQGEIDRYYAYVKESVLPIYFEESEIPIPVKFHQELKRYIKK